MTALTDTQLKLLQAANDGRLTVSGVRYCIDKDEVDTATQWAASDMLADGLLHILDTGPSVEHKPVRPTLRGEALLGGTATTDLIAAADQDRLTYSAGRFACDGVDLTDINDERARNLVLAGLLLVRAGQVTATADGRRVLTGAH